MATLAPLEAAQNGASGQLTANDISAAPNIFIYKIGENWPIDHYANQDWEDPIITVNNNSATIKLFVGLARDVHAGTGTLMNGGGYLTEVTYKASWLGNRTVTAYSGSDKSSVNLYLTDIPYGKQTIEVNAFCNVLLFRSFPDDLSTYPIPQNNTRIISFTVANSAETPTPIPSPITALSVQSIPIEYACILSIVALAIAASAIYVVAKRENKKSAVAIG
ncbi:MAG TPA: hypothetical protein VLH35_07265 [Candidatus Acidoferrales bacterium]|nr:hypothetical protein [Candidatus Acidoferrales bacterium]